MELVEVALELRHAFVAFPGFGNHHHHGMGEAPSGKNEEFEAVVEFLGIGTVLANDGEEFI